MNLWDSIECARINIHTLLEEIKKRVRERGFHPLRFVVYSK